MADKDDERPTLRERVPDWLKARRRAFRMAALVVLNLAMWLLFAVSSRVSQGDTSALAVVLVFVVVLLLLFSVIIQRLLSQKLTLGTAALLTGTALSVIIAVFSFIYFGAGTTKNWNIPLSHTDAVFVAVGTLTTAGTPGIQPLSELARGVMTVQMGLDLIVVFVVVGLAVARLAGRVQRRPDGDDPQLSAVADEHPAQEEATP